MQNVIISDLNSILKSLVQSKTFFEEYMDHVNNQKLKIILKKMLVSRDKMICELQQELENLGLKTDTNTIFIENNQALLEDIKNSMPKINDMLIITKELRKDERIVRDHYKKAMTQPIEPNLKKLFLKHIDKIDRNIEKSNLFSIINI